MNKSTDWELNSSSNEVKHVNGLCLIIEGNIKEPSGIIPVTVPNGISPIDLAALIREATEFCRNSSAGNHSSSGATVKKQAPKINPPNPSGRSVLRLKR